jgi:hypothetical protein
MWQVDTSTKVYTCTKTKCAWAQGKADCSLLSWPRQPNFDDLLELLDKVLCRLPAVATSVSRVSRTAVNRRLQTFLIRTVVNFDQFLACVKSEFGVQTKLDRSISNLHSIFGQLLQLILYLPHTAEVLEGTYHVFEISDASDENSIALPLPNILSSFETGSDRKGGMYAALLYGSAHLLRHFLDPTIKITSSEVTSSAIALCKVSSRVGVIDPGICGVLKASLFWAGLVLTTGRHPMRELSSYLQN